MSPSTTPKSVGRSWPAKIVTIFVHTGLGGLKDSPEMQKKVVETLALITGQKPVATKAKRAIASFKLRQGETIGYKTTLRRRKMTDFLNRLVAATLPRIRDFRGFSRRGFDGRGSYSFGLKDQSIFPEVPFEATGNPWSLQVTVVTTAKTPAETALVLEEAGFPLAKHVEESPHG